jgi:hypothetical protein
MPMRTAARVLAIVAICLVLAAALFAYSEWRREVYSEYGYGSSPDVPLADAEQTAIAWAYRYIFLAWGAAWVYSRRLVWTRGRELLSAGLLLMTVIGVADFLISKWFWSLSELGVTVMPWLHLVAVGCLVAGVVKSGSMAGRFVGTGSSWMNRYYATHDLISRAASTPTANEDLDRVKNRWHDALSPLVDEAAERTWLSGNEPSVRTLVLERYVDMPSFEGGACGQLRSVHVRFAGPGDPEPWMTAVVACEIDERPVGTFPVRNVDVLGSREHPSELAEFRRIAKFLRTGRLPRFDNLAHGLAALGRGLVRLALAVPVGAVALAYAPIKALLSRGHRRARFVPTRAPEALPMERTAAPVGYWNTLLPDLAPQQDQVATEVRRRLEERARGGIKVYEKDIVQWGGYQLKEVRRQLVIELRRAKAYVGVYAYGKDLYARWDSHLNWQTWLLQRFPYSSAVGYRFSSHVLSWAVPAFTEAPDVYEYALTNSRVTDYDWADVDAIQDLVHEILTDVVRGLKERYNIEKEIDFEMKQGWRGDERGGEEDGDEQSERATKRKRGRKGRFVRQQ